MQLASLGHIKACYSFLFSSYNSSMMIGTVVLYLTYKNDGDVKSLIWDDTTSDKGRIWSEIVLLQSHTLTFYSLLPVSY